MADNIAINGETYPEVDTVSLTNTDGENVMYYPDAVRFNTQTLTADQQAQARTNIAAAAAADIGTLSELKTTAQNNLVAAINEIISSPEITDLTIADDFIDIGGYTDPNSGITTTMMKPVQKLTFTYKDGTTKTVKVPVVYDEDGYYKPSVSAAGVLSWEWMPTAYKDYVGDPESVDLVSVVKDAIDADTSVDGPLLNVDTTGDDVTITVQDSDGTAYEVPRLIDGKLKDISNISGLYSFRMIDTYNGDEYEIYISKGKLRIRLYGPGIEP